MAQDGTMDEGRAMLEGCTPWPRETAKEYIRRGYWRAEGLTSRLEELARTASSRTFVSDAGGDLSYGEVEALAQRLAWRLLHHGLKPRDIVLLQLPNTREFVIVLFALLKAGIVPVLCLPAHRQSELSAFADLTGAKAYFFPQRVRNFQYLPMARELQAAIPSLQHLIASGDGSEPGVSYLDPWLQQPGEADLETTLAHRRPDPLDVAFLLLSGGTTGVPKLIPRTHADYAFNARECARVLGWRPDTAYLIALPIAHNFPLGQPGMVAALAVGGRVVLCPSTEPEAILAAIARHRATVLPASPSLLIPLLDADDRTRHDLRSLRQVYVGGQRMLPELVDRMRAAWSWARPGHAFGMAEGLTNLTRPDDPCDVLRETQGRPVSAADEIRIVDDSGAEVAGGAPGELLARGPYTIRGYYRAPEHNRTAFTPDGFYRTGDVVRRHPSGNLVVEGRRKDLINRGGEKISAEEVENLVLKHGSVHMAAVVAMPDAVMGEKSCAFISLKPGHSLTLAELNAFLLDKRIAKFKLPERLELVQSFPVTGMGKVSKKALREQIAAKLAGR
jgi:2,3-dihydroxybenzoate-AMP ligase